MLKAVVAKVAHQHGDHHGVVHLLISVAPVDAIHRHQIAELQLAPLSRSRTFVASEVAQRPQPGGVAAAHLKAAAAPGAHRQAQGQIAAFRVVGLDGGDRADDRQLDVEILEGLGAGHRLAGLRK